MLHIARLAKQLDNHPTATEGFAYHTTHGVRLRSIQKRGLLKGMPGVQHSTGLIHFSINLNISRKVYGKDITEGMPRRSGHHWLESWSYMYYQGVAVLRVNLDDLQALGYEQKNSDELTGKTTICPSKIDLYIDGGWKKLESANLNFSWLWFVIYWATPLLRK